MQAQTMYADQTIRKIIPIVPYSVKGKYRNIKTLILATAYSIYFSLPWLTWHGATRTGQPLLFDIAHSKFHFFDLVIYPQDLMVFTAIMVFAAALLFVSATLYGRIFCGFFCFQTIWTDAFRLIETLVQGEAQARIRLRKQPWHFQKIYKLGLTHMLWVILAFATAITFTLYFADANSIIQSLINGTAPIAAYTAIITVTLTTYAAAGIAKEDICRVACPYGKFQSVMQDPLTKTVVYDNLRGERDLGRAAPGKALRDNSVRAAKGYGDCIDCGYCVNVCPTGVDIRKGFQIDCISCGLCIDACDTIMTSVNLPTGLIKFGEMGQLQSEMSDTPSFWANKLKLYGNLTLLLACTAFLIFQLQHLEPFNATIQQQAQPLTTRLSDGRLKSRYLLHLTNKNAESEQFTVSSSGLPPDADFSHKTFKVPMGKSYTYLLDVTLSPESATQLKQFDLSISSEPYQAQHYTLRYISALN